ncbi:hypothetical protein OHB41_25890 [Streptomyces sp. NBC_01571]|uniref:hypothetical protein n=1 Tax=Streptomyces sp. NBC_01571 TaxID=2975883 RepID=UPI0022534392|nr:hypothetical protein [Streptomyces sp. NBC_01571]MCX4576543.1 hypothetical protein [Streptomyces sp. NBC_01571]
MNREQHLKLAEAAVLRAENLAGEAERYNPDNQRSEAHSRAGGLWSDIALTHVAIAQALTETPEV